MIKLWRICGNTMTSKIMRLYPFQVFRHRIYLPILSLIDRWKDLLRGIKTEDIFELNELGINPIFGTRYQPTSYATLRRVLKIAKNKGFQTIVDIGCGSGRSLVVANEVGFSNLYGVDISSKLIENSKLNFRKLNINAHLNVCDVSKYELPNGDLVIFLFNPFGAEKVSELVKKLVSRESKYLVIYHNPKHSQCFPSEPKLIDLKTHFGMYDELTYFYEL